MGNRTSYTHGTFSWVDLATTDQQAAKAFYGQVFGWGYDDMPAGEGVTYTMAKVGSDTVCAISPQRDDERNMGIPPHWNNYVTVDDVDAVTSRVAEVGGTVLVEPFEVLDVGRMAVIQEPTGAVLCVWQARRHIGASLVNAPGALVWNELATRDTDAASAFYSELLGWDFEKSEMGGEMDYWIIKAGDRSNGGMRKMGPEMPAEIPSHWMVYFGTDSVAESHEKATAAGAKTMMERTEMPMGALSIAADPQGAVFALYEGQFDD